MTKTEEEKERGTTFTKAPSTGLVKETILAGAGAPRERTTPQTPVLVNQGQGNATEVNTAVRGGQRRGPKTMVADLGGANTKGEAPANTPRHAQRRGHM